MSKNAGIIIIGDEILSGKVTDTNSTFLCKRFHALGIKVHKISTIPDDLKIIAEEVKLFSKLYDIVVTTGGVGPTHDDVTYEAVATAFDTTLICDEGLKQFFHWYIKGDHSEGSRLVTIPQCAEVIYSKLDQPLERGMKTFPIVKTFNVYNFPGIPIYLQRCFEGLKEQHFKNNEVQFFFRAIYLSVDEIKIVDILTQLSKQYEKVVSFGSYPRTTDGEKYENKITIESTSLEDCLAAEKELLMRIPTSWVIYILPRLPDFEFIHRLSLMDTHLSKKIRESFEVRIIFYLF